MLLCGHEHSEAATEARADAPGPTDPAAGAGGVSGPVAGAVYPRAERGDPTPVGDGVTQ